MILSFIEKLVDGCYACIPRHKPSIQALQQTRIIAHRGAHDNALAIIENTHAAFKRAQTLGCWGIELDIRCTADAQLVVHHDPDLQRLWGHSQFIHELSFKELRQLAPEIPLLTEIIDRYASKMHLFIELKAPFKAEEQLVQALQDLTACEEYHLLSLDANLFTGLKHFPPEALLLVAVQGNTQAFCKLSLEKGYGGVLGHYLLLNFQSIQQLQAAGKHCGVGFINSRFAMYHAINRKIPWLFSDRIARLIDVLAER